METIGVEQRDFKALPNSNLEKKWKGGTHNELEKLKYKITKNYRESEKEQHSLWKQNYDGSFQSLLNTPFAEETLIHSHTVSSTEPDKSVREFRKALCSMRSEEASGIYPIPGRGWKCLATGAA